MDGGRLPFQSVFKLKDGAGNGPIHFDSIGYAEEALQSWACFSDLQRRGVIPESVRLQVSLPMPLAVMRLVPADAMTAEPAYEAAIQRVVGQLYEVIPHRSLALQWDIAVEVIAFDGGARIYRDAATLPEHTAAVVAPLSEGVPELVRLGVQLCYGDPGYKQVIEPEDMGTLVRFASVIAARCPRRVDFMHMPVPRDSDDEAYFEPLRALKIGDCHTVLGLVHFTAGIEETKRRMNTADKFLGGYDIATECGFGHRPAETIPELLDIRLAALQ